MIVDCHGHYTTAPKALEAFRKRYIDAIDFVSAADKEKIFQGNARRIYGRFERAVAARG